MYPLWERGVLDYSEFDWLLFFKFLKVGAEIIDMGPVLCLMYVFNAINLSLRTALVTGHKLYVVFSVPFPSKYS